MSKQRYLFEVLRVPDRAALMHAVARLDEDQLCALRAVLRHHHTCTLCDAAFDLKNRCSPAAIALGTPTSDGGVAGIALICNECAEAHTTPELTKLCARQLIELFGQDPDDCNLRTVGEVADEMTAQMMEKLKKGRKHG